MVTCSLLYPPACSPSPLVIATLHTAYVHSGEREVAAASDDAATAALPRLPKVVTIALHWQATENTGPLFSSLRENIDVSKLCDEWAVDDGESVQAKCRGMICFASGELKERGESVLHDTQSAAPSAVLPPTHPARFLSLSLSLSLSFTHTYTHVHTHLRAMLPLYAHTMHQATTLDTLASSSTLKRSSGFVSMAELWQ